MEKTKLKRLVIHADDFGMTRGVTEGILKAIQNGCVTSTSCLVNFPTSNTALEQAKALQIDLGWHINLTLGSPVCDPREIPSLVQKDGTFYPLIPFIVRSFMGRIRAEDVEKELEAQYQKFSQHEISLSHADGHQHVHILPIVRDVVAQVVSEKEILFVRIPRELGGFSVPRWPARFFIRALTLNLSIENTRTLPFYGFSLGIKGGELGEWQKLLARMTEDTAEVMVHPAIFHPEDNYHGDDFPGDRSAELSLLIHPEFKKFLNEKGIELTNFQRLR